MSSLITMARVCVLLGLTIQTPRIPVVWSMSTQTQKEEFGLETQVSETTSWYVEQGLSWMLSPLLEIIEKVYSNHG